MVDPTKNTLLYELHSLILSSEKYYEQLREVTARCDCEERLGHIVELLKVYNYNLDRMLEILKEMRIGDESEV